RLAGPGAQQAGGVPGRRAAAAQLLERRPAKVACRLAVMGGKENLDTVAGAEIEELGDAERLPEQRQARLQIGLGDREARDVIDAGMPVRQAHDADLVHEPSRPRPPARCVTEPSSGGLRGGWGGGV